MAQDYEPSRCLESKLANPNKIPLSSIETHPKSDNLYLGRQRSDLVGKRVLCLPRNFEVAVPSPTQLSSSLWSPYMLEEFRKYNEEASAEPFWCPRHHHHQPNQAAFVNSSNSSRFSSIKQSSGTNDPDLGPVTGAIAAHGLSIKRARNLQQQSNTSRSTHNTGIRKSYSVMKGEHLGRSTQSTNNHLAPLKRRRINIDDPSRDPSFMRAKCDLCVSDGKNIHNSNSYLKHLSSQPWRLGTIRAVSHRDLNDKSISLMIEFDLLNWQDREWYRLWDDLSDDTGQELNGTIDGDGLDNLTDSAGDQSGSNSLRNIKSQSEELSHSDIISPDKLEIISHNIVYPSDHSDENMTNEKEEQCTTGRDCSRNRSKTINRGHQKPKGAFRVILIESSICCLTRKDSPSGKYKLWPGLMFEPLIDDIGLMSSHRLSAVEYFDPNDTFMQPNCDLKSIVSLLESEFVSSLKIDRVHFNGHQDHGVRDERQNTEPSPILEETIDCKCWSPRVEFLPSSAVYKLERQELSKKKLSSSDASWSQMNQKAGVILSSQNESSKLNSVDTHKSSDGPEVEQHADSSSRQPCPSMKEVETSIPPGGNGACLAALKKTNGLLETIINYPELYHMLKNWHSYQDAQGLLGNVCTAALLVGNRVRVYRTSGTTQWYTAVIIAYDEKTRLMTLIDDTVLEQHHEDPTLLEMHLIDDELIQSIIEGNDAASNVGSARRRNQRANQRQAAQVAQLAIMNSSTLGANNGAANGSTSSGSAAIITKHSKSSCLPSLSPAPSAASSSSSSAFSVNQQHMPADAIDQSQSGIDGRANVKRISSTRQHNNKTSARSKRKRVAQTSDLLDESDFMLNIGEQLDVLERSVQANTNQQLSVPRERLNYESSLEGFGGIFGRRLGEGSFLSPTSMDVTSRLGSVRIGNSKRSLSDGKNFLSHRLRLEELERRSPIDENPEGQELDISLPKVPDLSRSSEPTYPGLRIQSKQLMVVGLEGDPTKSNINDQRTTKVANEFECGVGGEQARSCAGGQLAAREGSKVAGVASSAKLARSNLPIGSGKVGASSSQSSSSSKPIGEGMATEASGPLFSACSSSADSRSSSSAASAALLLAALEEGSAGLANTGIGGNTATTSSGFGLRSCVRCVCRRGCAADARTCAGQHSTGQSAVEPKGEFESGATVAAELAAAVLERGQQQQLASAKAQSEASIAFGASKLADAEGQSEAPVEGGDAVELAGELLVPAKKQQQQQQRSLLEADGQNPARAEALGRLWRQKQKQQQQTEDASEHFDQTRNKLPTSSAVLSLAEFASEPAVEEALDKSAEIGVGGCSLVEFGAASKLAFEFGEFESGAQLSSSGRGNAEGNFVRLHAKAPERHWQEQEQQQQRRRWQRWNDDDAAPATVSIRKRASSIKPFSGANQEDCAEQKQKQKEKQNPQSCDRKKHCDREIPNTDKQRRIVCPETQIKIATTSEQTCHLKTNKHHNFSGEEHYNADNETVDDDDDDAAADDKDHYKARTKSTDSERNCCSASSVCFCINRTSKRDQDRNRIEALKRANRNSSDTTNSTYLSRENENEYDSTESSKRQTDTFNSTATFLAGQDNTLANLQLIRQPIQTKATATQIPFGQNNTNTNNNNNNNNNGNGDNNSHKLPQEETTNATNFCHNNDHRSSNLLLARQQSASQQINHHIDKHHTNFIIIDSNASKTKTTKTQDNNPKASPSSFITETTVPTDLVVFESTRFHSVASKEAQLPHSQPLENAILFGHSSTKGASSTLLASNVFPSNDLPSVPWTTPSHQQFQSNSIIQTSLSYTLTNETSESIISNQSKPRQALILLNHHDQELATTATAEVEAAAAAAKPLNAINCTNSESSGGQSNSRSSNKHCVTTTTTTTTTIAERQTSSATQSTSAYSLAMHSFGPNSQDQKKTDIPWPDINLNNNNNNNHNNNNNNINTNSNLSFKTSTAHSASHSALAAAAALQSLNQSHQQRSQQLAQLNSSNRLPPQQPSNPLQSPSAHGITMPKLGVTSTTSSDHHNHNHLASSNQQQATDNNDPLFSASRYQQQQNLLQQQKFPPGIRLPVVNWQDQTSTNLNSGPRWIHNNPYSTSFSSSSSSSSIPASSISLSTNAVNNLSNSNNMIGLDGDNQINNALSRFKNERQPLISNQFVSPQQNLDGKGPNNLPQSLRQQQHNYQWLENLKGSIPQLDNAKLQSQLEIEKSQERMNLFVFNLLNNLIPGTSKPKKIVPLDSIDDLRRSIYCGEFYTKYEDIAMGILTNQITVPEFFIIDYLRRDKFTLQEIERIESVHKRLGLHSSLLELAHHRSYLPAVRNNDINRPPHLDTINNLNVATGNYQQQQQSFNQQLQDLHKNNPYLPPLSGKVDIGLLNTDKNKRSTQSPSDIFSRSQAGNNGSNKILNAHSPSIQQNFPSISLPPTNSNQPLPVGGLRGQHPAHARSSPFHPMANQISVKAPPPPPSKHSSAMNLSGTIQDQSLNLSSSLPRQPPAAHQNSSARPNITGSNPSISPAHAHSLNAPNSTPITAHMSSKTPQTPRLSQAQDNHHTSNQFSTENHSPSGRVTDDRHIKSFGTNNQIGFSPNKSDIDPITGFPVHTLLSLKQHELVNKDFAFKRVGTPQFANNPNFIGLHQHQSLDASRSPVSLDPQFNSRSSPMNSQTQSIYPTNLNNNGLMFKPSMPNSNFVNISTSMPPPSSDYHKNDILRMNDSRSTMLSPNINPHLGTSEAQQKQYTAFLNAYQQQQQQQQHLLMPNKSGLNLGLSSSPSLTMGLNHQGGSHSSQQSPHSPQQSIENTLLLELQNQQQNQNSPYNDNRHNSIPQQPPSKQTNQRSIITGSASATGSKKIKKAKNNPSGQQTSDVKPATINHEPSDKGPAALNSTTCPNNSTNKASVPGSLTIVEAYPSSNANGTFTTPSISQGSENQSGIRLLSEAVASIETGKSAQGIQQMEPYTVSDADNSNTAQSVVPNLCVVSDMGGSTLSNIVDGAATDCPAGQHSTRVDEKSSFPRSTDAERDSSNISDLNVYSAACPSNVNNNSQNQETSKQLNTINPPSTNPETSKYQKLYTKKAWLKNYDEEDQTRLKSCPEEGTAPIKIEPIPEITTDSTPKGSKAPVVKVSDVKNAKTVKVEAKKKPKDIAVKKANTGSAARASRANRVIDQESEISNASTSELDSDEATSMKSSAEKRLRRMPRRKAKPSSAEKDEPHQSPKSRSAKDVPRKRGKKYINSDELGSKRKNNLDDDGNVKKSKKLKSSTKNATAIKSSDADQKTTKRQARSSPKLESAEDFDCKSPANDDAPSLNTELDDGSDDRIETLKKTGEKFLQKDPCYDIVPKSIRCLECRRVRQSSLKNDKILSSKQSSKTNWDDFCRFYEFRKLQFNKSSQIVVAGFSDLDDAKDSDKILWLPHTSEPPKNINKEVAVFILKHVGKEFCNLVMQERIALTTYNAQHRSDSKVTWKRAVNGLRELCDVCSTTLFNCHYVCERCGFVVCIDCYQSRARNASSKPFDNSFSPQVKKEQELNISEKPSFVKSSTEIGENGQAELEQSNIVTAKKSKRDSQGWIYCAKNEEHAYDKLILTQIIAGDCLEEVWNLLHDIRRRFNLDECACTNSAPYTQPTVTNTPTENSHSTLKSLLLAANEDDYGENTVRQPMMLCDDDSQEDIIHQQVTATIDKCLSTLDGPETDYNHDRSHENNNKCQDFEGHSSFLCDGDLLVLTKAQDEMNIQLFRDQWRIAKPVLVRGVDKSMKIDMWLPQFFGKEFGDYRSDLVDCRNGDIHRHSMKKYWEGFEPTNCGNSTKKRAKDDSIPLQIPSANNEECSNGPSYYIGSALWRLKDWPPGQDFFEILPQHYGDFMNNLPLQPYTTRSGKLNLACRLPKEMLKPDLGPKMYSAYGTMKFPERGTTNLHLDISDAINVMVYVSGATSFRNGSEEQKEIFDKIIGDCFIDQKMKEQIRSKELIPGALWHIFKPEDAQKMRDFLNKVSDERKISAERRNDPIHDQTWYLDQTLLDRLLDEYGVKSYAILQCMGDAILIPAGAPHQVKNLQNCIKVANDFVSPENVKSCLQLTNEFRSLPETHINQEDKLQIKNILYHSVKESLQYIKLYESGKVDNEDEDLESKFDIDGESS